MCEGTKYLPPVTAMERSDEAVSLASSEIASLAKTARSHTIPGVLPGIGLGLVL